MRLSNHSIFIICSVLLYLLPYSNSLSTNGNNEDQDYIYEDIADQESSKTTSTASPTASLAVEVITTIVNLLLAELNEDMVNASSAGIAAANISNHSTIISMDNDTSIVVPDLLNSTTNIAMVPETTSSMTSFTIFSNSSYDSIPKNDSLTDTDYVGSKEESLVNGSSWIVTTTSVGNGTNFSRFRIKFFPKKLGNTRTDNETAEASIDNVTSLLSDNGTELWFRPITHNETVVESGTSISGTNVSISTDMIVHSGKNAENQTDFLPALNPWNGTGSALEESVMNASLHNNMTFGPSNFVFGLLDEIFAVSQNIMASGNFTVDMTSINISDGLNTTQSGGSSAESEPVSFPTPVVFPMSNDRTKPIDGAQQVTFGSTSTSTGSVTAKHEIAVGLCSHRSADTLSTFESENIISLFVDTTLPWNHGRENLLCKIILDELCAFTKRNYGSSDCSSITLHLIDEPISDKAGMRIFFLATRPPEFIFLGNETMALLKGRKQEIEHVFDSMFSNLSCLDHKQPTTTPTVNQYKHFLDDPVIATSLIVVVISVFVVALFSLATLVLCQRHRRSRKGEWIVNKQGMSDRGNRRTNLAYNGRCFENDAYSNDGDKRRSVLPAPLGPPPQPPQTMQLLDDRRQKLILPVDSPCFDVNECVFFPPPPPSLSTFGHCDNGIHSKKRKQIAPPPPPSQRKSTNAYDGWQVGGQTMEMELMDTGNAKRKRKV